MIFHFFENRKHAGQVRKLFAAAALAALCLPGMRLHAQDGGTRGDFILGAGARAIGLGNAYVAMPYDATAVYWNPAGLDNIDRSNLVFFYSPLLAGTHYNYVGYAYPTIQIGTIGVGVLHVTTGDITERDSGANPGEVFAYSHTLAMVSYGKKLPYSLSAGVTIKLERMQQLNANASGAGIDFGLLYSPESDLPLIQNFTLGLSIQNLIAPRLKLISTEETGARTLRVGIARPIDAGGGGDRINLLFGLQFSEHAETRFNFGTEYVFQNKAMVRAGFDGLAPSFGGGIDYRSYRIDYAVSRVAEAADISSGGLQHRISLTMEFGKTKTERIEIAQAAELKRIEEETLRRINLTRRVEFEDFMNKGKTYFQDGDYFVAMIRFASAREIFPGNDEARQWLERAENKLAEQRQQELAREVAEAGEAERQAFITAQFEKGRQLLEAGKLAEAITEWQRGLERDPENELLRSSIEKTENEIKEKVARTLERARDAEAKNLITVALEYYGRAQNLNAGLNNAAERQALEKKITELRKQLTFNDIFRQGLTAYIEKNYKLAMQRFEEALRLAPRDEKLKQYLDDAEARANARIVDFPNEAVRRKFLEAVRHIQRERYTDALDILYELQKQQRYNKRILDAIDLARERQQKQ